MSSALFPAQTSRFTITATERIGSRPVCLCDDVAVLRAAVAWRMTLDQRAVDATVGRWVARAIVERWAS